MRKSVFINLTDEQLKQAESKGEERHFAKDTTFRNTSIYMKGLSDEIACAQPHKVGMIGEYAYSVFSGKKYDEKIYSVRDSGIDFGKDVEVKTITYMGPDPELKIKLHEFTDPNRIPKKYVLARYNKRNPNIVELVGEISREDFNKHKIVKRYNGQNHDNYVIGIDHLQTVTP